MEKGGNVKSVFNRLEYNRYNTGDSDALLLSREPSGLPQDNNKCKYLSVVCIYAHSHTYITYYI